MPALTETNVRHLLRRTEFVDRDARVTELLAKGSIEAAVDDVMAVDATPPTFAFTESEEWQRQQEMAEWWLDRMAHDSPRPFQERMALWWHNHFATSFEKLNLALAMREQIDLFRRDCLGNVRDLAIEMSTQVAMLRYLDNNENKASSPNQNFARELMELFVLGVGNYSEADVEAATAAWTGHTDQWDDEVSPYRWRPEWHDGSTKSFLGRTINNGGDAENHGAETIEVMLSNGVVPAGTTAGNAGRSTRDVAAEFLTRKLWLHFASGEPSAAVTSRLSAVLVANDFDVRPWVRALLLDDEFYTEATRSGLVRNPAEYVVALMVATDLTAAESPTWLMPGMGQRLFFAPNVAGWKTNGYWVNASSMEARARAARSFYWRATRDYWDAPNVIRLGGGTMPRDEITARDGGVRLLSDEAFLDALIGLSGLKVASRTREALLRYAGSRNVWERIELFLALMLAPEVHMA